MKALTVRRINVPNPAQRIELHDRKVRGLRIRITPTGKKTLSFVYWSPAAHKQRRITLNSWPEDLTAQGAALDYARSRALTLAAAVATGEDPGAPEDVAQGDNVDDLVPAGYLADVKATLSPMSHRLLRRVLERHVLPVIGSKPGRPAQCDRSR